MDWLLEWLTELLGVEAPPNTQLVSAELGLRGGLPLWIAIGLLVLFAGGAGFLYAHERGRLGTGRRAFLTVLRTAVLALILLMLLRPVLVAVFKGERSRPIALLLDSSHSMNQKDKRLSVSDRFRVAVATGLLPADTTISDAASLTDLPDDTPIDPSRIDLVKAVLSDKKRDLVARLQEHGPVRPFFFGNRLRNAFDESGSRDKEGGSLDRLLSLYQAEDGKTALGDAVAELLQRKDGDPPAAIVLVTDGQKNAGKLSLLEAARECGRHKVPLHIWGVGSSEAGLLQLRDLTVSDTIFYDDTIEVPVRWRARGLKKGKVQIVLALDGKEVARTEVDVKLGEDLSTKLAFTPHKEADAPEKQKLEATITYMENNVFKDTMPRTVKLSDSRIKVLYIEHAPRWEYKFLQAALLRDRRVEPHFLLVRADPKIAQGGPPFLAAFPTREQLLTYDLVIVGDVASSYLGGHNMELLREFVRDFKGGLILIAGRQHAPGSYDGTPLAEVLPVEFLPQQKQPPPEARPQPYAPALTIAGESSDIMSLGDTPEESLKVWAKLPGFYWHYPVTRLRDAATALLVHPRNKMAEQPMPVVATHHYGKGQVLFMATDETWRWRYNAEDQHFIRFWGQAIYQLALPHHLGKAARRFQFALERSEALLDRPGTIFARLLDKDFRPLKDKEVKAELEFLDAKPDQEGKQEIVFRQRPGHDGDYEVFLPHNAAGKYELRVPGMEEPFQYRVDEPPGHELEKSGLADVALSQAAIASSGRFYREDNLSQLPDQVEAQKIEFILRQEVLLWNPLILVLFVGLITTEWVVRKFSNLS
jgi:hypothetical protein